MVPRRWPRSTGCAVTWCCRSAATGCEWVRSRTSAVRPSTEHGRNAARRRDAERDRLRGQTHFGPVSTRALLRRRERSFGSTSQAEPCESPSRCPVSQAAVRTGTSFWVERAGDWNESEPGGLGQNRLIGLAYGEGAVWAAGFESGTLIRIDPSAGSMQSLKVGDMPVGVTVAGRSVWIATTG